MVELDVEVLTVSFAQDVASDSLLYQVAFGVIKKNPQSNETNNIGVNRLILFMPKKEPCPYIAGSKWKINIEKDGDLKVTKAN